jgi:hypothetical protein
VRARLSVLCTSLALLVAVAGCGGGGSSSDGTKDSAKEAFISEADAQCSEYQAKVAPIKAELQALEQVAEPESPVNEKQLGELLNEALAEGELELEGLRELEPPPGDEATIEKLLAAAEEGNGLAGEAATALEEADAKAFGELVAEGEEINHRATKIAENYGLKVCGQSP